MYFKGQKVVILDHVLRSYYDSQWNRQKNFLKPYVSKIGEVRDYTQSMALVKFEDGNNYWIERDLLKPVDLKDLIRMALNV